MLLQQPLCGLVVFVDKFSSLLHFSFNQEQQLGCWCARATACVSVYLCVFVCVSGVCSMYKLFPHTCLCYLCISLCPWQSNEAANRFY